VKALSDSHRSAAIREKIESIRRRIGQEKRRLESGQGVESYKMDHIREEFDEIESASRETSETEWTNELTSLGGEVQELSRAIERSSSLRTIEDLCRQGTPTNWAAVKGILRRLDEAESVLADNGGMLDDLASRVGELKRSLAWIRAKKKLADSDIAAAMQNGDKAEKLRREAEYLLAQDWKVVFPSDEGPPPLS
jgi:chromosome segregation ATPase